MLHGRTCSRPWLQAKAYSRQIAVPEPILALTSVSKSFPGVRALHDVSLSLRPGRVTALIGENGAGKSTIVKILTGIYKPDAGSIRVGGEEKSFASPRDAWAAGIAAIHQETVMFDELSVSENIFMGHMPTVTGKLVAWPEMRARTAELLKRIDAAIPPDFKLKRLSVAQKHLVEIARALISRPRVLIMDEPTSSLASADVEKLFQGVGKLDRKSVV